MLLGSVCVEPESITSAEYCNAAERTTTHHSNAKSTSVPTTFHSFFSLSPCHPFLPSSHPSSSSLSFLRSALLSHFTAACKGARDSDTHFHASLINTEGRLFITLISILQWPSHYTMNPYIIQVLKYSWLKFLHAEMDKLAMGALLLLYTTL